MKRWEKRKKEENRRGTGVEEGAAGEKVATGQMEKAGAGPEREAEEVGTGEAGRRRGEGGRETRGREAHVQEGVDGYTVTGPTGSMATGLVRMARG